MSTLDINNIYSGSYALSAGAGTWTAQAATTNTTSYSTNAVDHNPALQPLSATPQNVQAGLGEPQAVVLIVTAAPGHTGAETYTASLLTDTNANLTTAPVTLASLTIPNTTVANTAFVLVIPPTLNFLRYSGIKYVLADGGGTSSLSVISYLVPVSFIAALPYYQSGWTIENS